MKKITNNIIIHLGLFLIFLLSSCMFSPKIEEEIRGDLNITLNRAPINQADDSLTFNLSVACMENGYKYEGTFDNSNSVVLNNIRSGIYHIRVSATDGFNNYEGVLDKEIIFNDTNKDTTISIDIVIKQTTMNGQIALDFTSISLDPSSIFNVYVNDKSGNEVYKEEGVKPSSIIENKYVVNHFFEKGEYSVVLTGGNSYKEEYVVNNKAPLFVDEGKLVLYPVVTLPYSIYYVDETASNSTEDGSSSNPFKSFNKAIEKYESSKTAVQIILKSNVTVPKTIILNNAIPLSISSLSGSKISSDALIFINNKASLTLKDVELKTTANSEIELNGGSLTLKSGVYIEKYNIKESFLKTNPILVEGDVQSKSGGITLILDTLKDNLKIFNLSFNSSFDNSTVDIGSSSFVIDRSGKIREKKSEYALTLNPIKGFTNQEYEIKNKGITLKKGKLDSLIKVPVFKGDSITVIVFGDETGKRYGFSKDVVIEGNIEVKFSDTDKKLYSSTITFITNSEITLDDLPLNVTLKNSKNESLSHVISELSPSNLNSIIVPPDTYTFLIEGKHLEELYTAQEITLKSGETKECPILTSPSFSYYVSETALDTGNGTKENPFNSLSKVLTPEVLQSTTKQNILINIDGTITENTVFDITSPLDITIQGVSGKSSTLQSPLVTPYIILHHPQAHLSFKNITTTENRPDTNDRDQKEIATINIIQGVLSLLKDSVITTSSKNCFRAIAFEVTSESDKRTEAIIEIYDNAYPTTIALMPNAKIYLMNSIVGPDYTGDNRISIYGSRFYSGGGQVLYSGKPGDFSPVETSYFRFRYPNNLSYSFTPDGHCTYMYDDTAFQIQKAIDSPDLEVKIRVSANTKDEITRLFNLLRQIPKNKKVDLQFDNYGYKDEILDTTIWNTDQKGIDTIRSIIIGDYIKTIGDNTFSNFKNLETIQLPKELEIVGSNLFSGCNKLTEIKIGEAIREIGKNAFGNTFTKLTLIEEYEQKFRETTDKTKELNFTFSNPQNNATLYKQHRGDSLTHIFSYDCLKRRLRLLTEGVTDLNIPTFELEIPMDTTVESLYSDGPFKIKIVNTPRITRNYFTEMGANLKGVSFDENVESLPPFAFEGLNITFTMDEKNPNFQIKSGLLLTKKGDELLSYAGNTPPTIPSSVKRIVPQAFKNTGINGVTFTDNSKTWTTEKTYNTFIPRDTTSNELATYLTSTYVNEGLCQTIGFKDVEKITTDAYNNGIADLILNIKTSDTEVNNKDISIHPYFYEGNITLNLKPSDHTFTFIPDNFANGKEGITKVIFSNYISKIGDNAFENTKVKDYEVPSNIKEFGIKSIGFNESSAPKAKIRFIEDSGIINTKGEYLYVQDGEECGDKFRTLIETTKAFRGGSLSNCYSKEFNSNTPINQDVSTGVSNLMYFEPFLNETSITRFMNSMKNSIFAQDFNLVLCSHPNENNTVHSLDNSFNGNTHLKKLVIPQSINTISSDALVGTGLVTGKLSFQDTKRTWHVKTDVGDTIDLSTASLDQVFTFFTRPGLEFTYLE